MGLDVSHACELAKGYVSFIIHASSDFVPFLPPIVAVGKHGRGTSADLL